MSHEQFAQMVADPSYWYRASYRNLMSAGCLHFNSLVPALSAESNRSEGLSQVEHLSRSILLLAGYGLENLAKGLIVEESGPTTQFLTPNGKLGYGLDSHDLSRLFARLSISLNPKQMEFLSRLGRYVTWIGRYEIPVNSSTAWHEFNEATSFDWPILISLVRVTLCRSKIWEETAMPLLENWAALENALAPNGTVWSTWRAVVADGQAILSPTFDSRVGSFLGPLVLSEPYASERHAIDLVDFSEIPPPGTTDYRSWNVDEKNLRLYLERSTTNHQWLQYLGREQIQIYWRDYGDVQRLLRICLRLGAVNLAQVDARLLEANAWGPKFLDAYFFRLIGKKPDRTTADGCATMLLMAQLPDLSEEELITQFGHSPKAAVAFIGALRQIVVRG